MQQPDQPPLATARPRITWDQARLVEIAERWKVTRLELFGSVLRDDFRPDSDVDVLVTFAPDARVSLFGIVDFGDELAGLFGRRVDVVTRPSIEQSPNYLRRREILRDPLTIMVRARRTCPSSFGSFTAVERSAGTTTALRGKEVAMKASFVAGFGPIVRDVDASREFWGTGLGIQLQEAAPSYWTNDDLDGVKAFALWPLAQAAESCFGGNTWPPEIPAPQAWVEFDVESPAAVAAAVSELEAAGHRLLREAREEPWGQTTARLLSPEGLLVGVAYTPWMHRTGSDEEGAGA